MYSECLNCEKIGVSCDGPNFMAMGAPELLAWCKARKAHLHLTNGRLAEMSGMPKGTIDRLFAGEHVDFRFETIRPLLKALTGGAWSGNPCAAPQEDNALQDELHRMEQKMKRMDEKARELAEENARLQDHIKEANKQHGEQLKFLRGEIKRKNKFVTVLAILSVVALLYIIVTLIIDMADPSRGIFWLESLLHLPQGTGISTEIIT